MIRRFPSLVIFAAAAAVAGGCITESQAVRDNPRVEAPPPGPAYDPPPPDSASYDSYQAEAPPPPSAGTDVASEAVFYDRLSPYGYWTLVAPYGRVWVPAVGYGWRPYYYGQWVLTDWGWTFVSDDPWGWAAYHYGRWNFAVGVGWYWIPGVVWAPAWVSWRYGAGYVTWCPLGPPGVVFGYHHPAWVAVPEQHFTRPIAAVAVPSQRTYGFVTQARPLSGPNAAVAHGGSFGPPVASVSRATGQQIRPLAATQVVHPRPAVRPYTPSAPMRSPVQPRARIDGYRSWPAVHPSSGPHPVPGPAAPSGSRAAPPSGGGSAPHASPPSSGGSSGQPHATSPRAP